jgi:lipopolysaccharide transport system permease protein
VSYRELFWSLALRDYKVRYAQTSIGLLWAVIQPVTSILILNVVFGRFANVDSEGLPHLLYATSGMACWTYFSYVLTNSGNSIIVSQAMIKKIYFPRIIVPLSKAVVGFIDFIIVLIILLSLMIYYGISPSANIAFLPFFVLLNIIAALGVGIWISALTVRFRDFQYVVPFLVQIGLYASPVAFPSSYATEFLPSWAAKLFFLNPIVGVIDGFRWSLFGTESLTTNTLLSFVGGLLIFVSGVVYFQRVEGKIADIV